MKKLLLTIFLNALVLPAFSQKADLFIKRAGNEFFLEHKVAAKESFFSVGRLYNVHPRAIANYNKLDYNKGLFLDKIIRIPLTDTNFTQKANKGTPVYYKAGEKDDWNSIAKSFRVSGDKLRTWNEGDVKKGQKIIVGLLLSPEMTAKTFTARNEPDMTKKEVKEEKEAIREEKKDLDAAEKKDKMQEEKPEQKKPAEIIPVAEIKTAETANYERGFFKTAFEQQVRSTPASKEQTVTSGIFKTASGWQDGKYYLLIDGVSPGTLIKVTNPTNNRMIYAKVLGEMSGIRLNDGLNMRLSNAAVAALDITETDKFILKVNY